MLLQQPVLAEQCHDKGLRRRLLRPYPYRSPVACSDSSPKEGSQRDTYFEMLNLNSESYRSSSPRLAADIQSHRRGDFLDHLTDRPTVCMLDGDMNERQAIRMAHDMHSGDTERRILDSARRLFAEKGYEKTSIQDILDDLGLSKGGLYHHFKSKEAILDRLNADEWAATARLLDKLIERKDMSALEKLRVLIVSAVDAPDHLDLVRSQLALLKDPAFFTANMRFWSTRLPESFRSLIDMGVQDGSIPTAYPEEAAQLLSLLGNYWLMPCFYPADRAGMEHRIRCLATMLDAIGVPVFDETLILRMTEGLTALTPEEDTASA